MTKKDLESGRERFPDVRQRILSDNGPSSRLSQSIQILEKICDDRRSIQEAVMRLGYIVMLAMLGAASTTTVLTACKMHSATKVKVVGESTVLAAGDFKFANVLRWPDASCTGSIVRDDLILTAHHCVFTNTGVKQSPVTVQALPDGGTRTSSQYLTLGSSSTKYVSVGQDLAFIIFPHNTFPVDWIGALATNHPQQDDRVTMIGQGTTAPGGRSGVGILRSGKNFISLLYDGKIVVIWDKGYTKVATTSYGDSGGPLLNDQNQIIGVTSGGECALADGTKTDCKNSSYWTDHAYFTDTQIGDAQAFIQSTMSNSAPQPTKAAEVALPGQPGDPETSGQP